VSKHATCLICSDCVLCASRSLSWDDFYNGTFKAEFATEFKPPYDEEETIQWMEAYLERVEHMVQRLEDAFDNSAVSGTRKLSMTSSTSR
jgi:hypothetical protein